MQECHIIITFLATTLLTKNAPMNVFFSTTCSRENLSLMTKSLNFLTFYSFLTFHVTK